MSQKTTALPSEVAVREAIAYARLSKTVYDNLIDARVDIKIDSDNKGPVLVEMEAYDNAIQSAIDSALNSPTAPRGMKALIRDNRNLESKLETAHTYIERQNEAIILQKDTLIRQTELFDFNLNVARYSAASAVVCAVVLGVSLYFHARSYLKNRKVEK